MDQYRLFKIPLMTSLLRALTIKIGNLHIVIGFSLNTSVLSINIIKNLWNSIAIKPIYSSVLHQFYVPFIP